MSVLEQINRDFPYQVVLSLDDKVDGIPDWLDQRIGNWDMYVDLKDQSIRYCFQHLADAYAFNRLFSKAA